MRAAAERLHDYLQDSHVRGGALIGPDPGVRFNYRFWRFLKSAWPHRKWGDDLYYLQAQGYWVLANWRMSASTDDRFARLALAACDQILTHQRSDGAWNYPNPEWKGRVATVEGIWGALGLLESFHRTAHPPYLLAVKRWDGFFRDRIGYQQFGPYSAVNYFAVCAQAAGAQAAGADDPRRDPAPHAVVPARDLAKPVPNNSALALRYLAAVAAATNEPMPTELRSRLVQFIRHAQLPSGEIPYVYGDPKRVHFQCYQYHAFIFLDLLEYHRLSQDDDVLPVLRGIAGFLATGVRADGRVDYQCGVSHRTVYYHTCAVAAALSRAATVLGHVESWEVFARQAYEHVLRQQRADGSLPHSRGDYRVLADRRSYPRYLAMMLHHLLLGADGSLRDSAPLAADWRDATVSTRGSLA